MSNIPTPTTIAQSWLDQLASHLASGSPEAVASLFQPDGWWRDHLCLSWDFHANEGVEVIKSFLKTQDRITKRGLNSFIVDAGSPLGGPSFQDVPGQTGAHSVEATFRFQIRDPAARGRGFVRLSSGSDGEWKAFLVYTALTDLEGHEEPNQRPTGHYDGHTRSWDSVVAQEFAAAESHPSVLVVGAGQAGLMLAARLKALKVNTLLIEKTSRIGDNWRNRYESLTLHTTVTHASYPYQAYPANMPTYIPRTKLANFPVWTSAELLPGSTYDTSSGRWTVTILHNGTRVTLRPKHVVLATGPVGVPLIPKIPGQDKFKGITYHSSAHREPEKWRGKNVVVVGAGVSGNDMALDLTTRGAKVLMIQRSPICVIRQSTLKISMDRAWPEGRPAEESDFLLAATPLKLLFRIAVNHITPSLAEQDKEMLDGLRKAGYLTGWGEEMGYGPIGQLGLISTKLGGFYLDVGNAQRIIDGEVKIKSGVELAEFEESGVRLSDGTFAPADCVVFATGYHPMGYVARQLFGEEIIKQTSPIWNLDAEGELRGVFRPTGHPGLWFAAGGFDHARYLSQFLALQLLAREVGVYKE
ncbi:FAD/NAD(P)-binding domain-containing protein [Sistotremastrum suecicum HHB10207 ss-3]|uniref:FAD/NAD(P)-binding domain-containing protein n=1 Tax=Sistotremastrum suecicum HHB10207 ss-3 TaxID=1314776 RepID=A0A165XJP9_9AGAM|nr:FAD/NAD(P)-binding domain-containing protein [Sistotremastrum suecicum HHB10207 ss-3]